MSDWFGGILETVRQKSEVLINMYKEDLQEFTSTITEDTKKVIETQVTAAAAANAIGGLEKIIHQIAGGEVEDEKDIAFFPPPDSSLYSKEPEDMEDYNIWLAGFDIKTKTEEISELLASDEHMRNLHREMVPATVSYGEFWQRYFYHYNKLKEKEDRRAALLERANAAIASKETTEDLGWDIDEFENDETVTDKTDITSAPVDSEQTPEKPQTVTQEMTTPATPPSADSIPIETEGTKTPTPISTSPSPSTPPPVTSSPKEPSEALSTTTTTTASSITTETKPSGTGAPGEGEDWADWE